MSTFHLLVARELNAPVDQLYPAPGERPDSVQPQEDDGEALSVGVKDLIVREVPAGGSPKRIAWLKNVNGMLGITESRLTIASSKYEIGGGAVPWTPAAIPLAATINVLTKRKASQRREGKMLVGHVKYPMLVSVGFMPPVLPIGGHEQLRIGTIDPTQQGFRGLILDVGLVGGQRGAVLAQAIASRAARSRLASGEALSDALKGQLERLTDPAPLQSVPRRFSSYFFADPGNGAMVAAFQQA